MSFSRRQLFAASAGFASIAAVRADSDTEREAARLAARSEEANDLLMRGDVAKYRALIPITEDFTLMSPFGGTPTRGSQLTEERWDAMRRFFRNGTLTQEVIQSYASADMIVLAVIEHAHVEVGTLPAQNWSLRVTLVFRREGGTWKLAHRHADPLSPGISLEQAAALARPVTAG